MVKIRWTPEAEKWLRDIYDYIARDNVSAAQRVVAGIYKRHKFLGNSQRLVTSIGLSLKGI